MIPPAPALPGQPASAPVPGRQPVSAPVAGRRHASALRRLLCAACALLLAGGLSAAGVLGSPLAAQAAGKVSVSGTPSAEGTSTLTLSGSGFQSVQNGFGGIYVLFGVVEGTWQPSKGGKTGANMRYAYDDESKPEGFQLFVTFPGSTTAYAANGGQLAADGSWSGTIKLPGARFTSYDRQRNPVDVDCTKEQCGIITIGAHGVANANNETFTPVDFPAGGAGGEQDAPADASGAAPAAEAAEGEAAPQPTAGSGPVAAPVQPAAPLIGPEQVDALNANGNRIVLILLAGIVVTASLIALAVGVGAYMAAKSLLLGVSPEALERVRARRAKRAIAAEHKRKRRVFDYRAKQEARTRRHTQRTAAALDRRDIEASGGQLATGPEAPAGLASPLTSGGRGEPDGMTGSAAPTAGPMRFFELISSGGSGVSGAPTVEPGAGGPAPGTSGAPAGEAATLVLERTAAGDAAASASAADPYSAEPYVADPYGAEPYAADPPTMDADGQAAPTSAASDPSEGTRR